MSKKSRSAIYEGVYILRSVLSEDAREKALNKLVTFVKSLDGVHHKTIEWGRKRMEYPISSCRDGCYYLIYFSLPTHRVDEIISNNHINEDLIRFMHIKINEVPDWDEVSFNSILDVERKKSNASNSNYFSNTYNKSKKCPFKSRGIKHIDYKDVETLRHFITEYGKILPARMTNVSLYYQHKLNKSIKRARHVALLPFVARN